MIEKKKMIETHNDTPTWSSRKAILSFWGVTCIALRWQNVPPIVVYSAHTNKDIFFLHLLDKNNNGRLCMCNLQE